MPPARVLYEPQVNRTYAEMAAHYDTAVLPARPRRPRDKAKVEMAVLIIEGWLLGRLRHRRFYSLAELNAAIGELLRQLNEERPIRHLGVTRRALLEELDWPRLKGLLARPSTDRQPMPSRGDRKFPARAKMARSGALDPHCLETARLEKIRTFQQRLAG